jgi:hypothetical protein
MTADLVFELVPWGLAALALYHAHIANKCAAINNALIGRMLANQRKIVAKTPGLRFPEHAVTVKEQSNG